MAIISIFVIGAIALMIGFVTNLGTTVRERIKLQNAADAAASSTSLWMARAMNDVTATNHMMGEATAILAVIEGFGGPLLGSGATVTSAESTRYNAMITAGSTLAPLLPAGKLSARLVQPDREFVGFVKQMFTSDRGRHDAGGAIYDGKMMLKHTVFMCFTGKKIGNIAMLVSAATSPEPVTSLTFEVTGVGIHAAMDAALLKCIQEWIALDVVQKAVVAIKSTSLPDKVESLLIPSLSVHADTVVGLGAAASVGQAASPMNRAIQSTLDELAREHDVSSLETAPPWAEIALPLDREPAPPTEASADGKQGPWEHPPFAWSGSYESVLMREVMQPARAGVKAMNSGLQVVKQLVDIWGKAEDLGLELPPWVKQAEKAVKKAVSELEEAQKALAMPPPSASFPGNPLLDPATPAEFRLPEFHWQIEQRSQWVRATHPYVDDYRSAVIQLLRAVAPISNAATSYVHWTDRFTLAKSFELRTKGDRPCHMYVIRGSTAETKGAEPWTTDGGAAERLFCVAAVAIGKPPPAIMTDAFFRPPSGERRAVSQAMVYNANGRTATTGADRATQPTTGWDTLNWLPPVTAWEWADHRPSTASGSLYEVLGGSKLSLRSDRVMLNWQTKLVPVNPDFVNAVAPPGMASFVEVLLRDRRMLSH